jgi:hypothetical protein
MWNQRVRGLETDFFAALLGSSAPLSSKWAQELAQNLLSPRLPLSLLDAVGIRLRRNYLWIFFILGTAWLAKYWLFPAPPSSWNEFVGRAVIGPVPGTVVVGFSLAYFLTLILVAMLTMSLTGSKSSHEGTAIRAEGHIHTSKRMQGRFGWKRKKRTVLAFILTEKADEVSSCILRELKRGVTSIGSTDTTMLICALTVNEIKSLRNAVNGSDANATIDVTSADGIWGKGFDPIFNE